MAIIKKYQAEVVHLIDLGEGVFTLEMKSIGSPFKYAPGQFLHLALDEYDPSMGWPESRCFSMQTSPQNENIRITYAVKGTYTQRMAKELKAGCEVQLKLPYGDLFDQEHHREHTVFIAGGTGITPFLSLFNDGRFQTYQHPVLYLGLRSEKYHFYRKELDEALHINPSLAVHIRYQEQEGMLDIAQILEANTTETSYFISGPPVMIKHFKANLVANGVNEGNVLTDDWE